MDTTCNRCRIKRCQSDRKNLCGQIDHPISLLDVSVPLRHRKQGSPATKAPAHRSQRATNLCPAYALTLNPLLVDCPGVLLVLLPPIPTPEAYCAISD